MLEVFERLVCVLITEWGELATNEVVRRTDLLNQCHRHLVSTLHLLHFVLAKEAKFCGLPKNPLLALGVVATPSEYFTLSPDNKVVQTYDHLVNLGQFESIEINQAHFIRLFYFFPLAELAEWGVADSAELVASIILRRLE